MRGQRVMLALICIVALIIKPAYKTLNHPHAT